MSDCQGCAVGLKHNTLTTHTMDGESAFLLKTGAHPRCGWRVIYRGKPFYGETERDCFSQMARYAGRYDCP